MCNSTHAQKTVYGIYSSLVAEASEKRAGQTNSLV